MRRIDPVFERINNVSVVMCPTSRLIPGRRATRHTGCCENHILCYHFITGVNTVQIGDACLGRTAAFIIIAEQQAP